jgi:hypothetical protein
MEKRILPRGELPWTILEGLRASILDEKGVVVPDGLEEAALGTFEGNKKHKSKGYRTHTVGLKFVSPEIITELEGIGLFVPKVVRAMSQFTWSPVWVRTIKALTLCEFIARGTSLVRGLRWSGGKDW